MAVLRFTIASVVLAICFIQNGSARIYEPVNAENSSDVEISIGGINEFMAMYPDANIEQLQMQSKVRGRMNYTLGSRLSGKRIVFIQSIETSLCVSDKVICLGHKHINSNKKVPSYADTTCVIV